MTTRVSTVIECFDERLLILEAQGEFPYRGVKASGKTTAYADAPKLLLYSKITKFEDIAESVLSHCRTNTNLGSKEISSTVSCMTQANGHDVMQTSAIYIIMPIIEVLNVIFPDGWTISTELTSLDPDNIEKDEEQVQEGVDVTKKPNLRALRYDLVIRYKGNNVLAIIEYKRQGLIRYQDYHLALVDESTSPEEIRKKQAALDLKPNSKLLKCNGLVFSKQLVAHTTRSRCPHIALFNWDHLLVLEMPAAKDQEGDNEFVNLSWVHEGDDQPSKYMEVGRIRKVLLGFILNAFDDAGYKI
ncbi:hypothetical protein J1614_003312 [Plenodomus biglobosus]|nr:hypothetical protein J1614_003312 [Plenodomus biglobosus]